MKWLKNYRGDTLVEVLISIAVASFILSAAYSLANRSSQAIRQSQERSEALKAAESQQETLIAFLGSGQALPASTQPFCLQNQTTVIKDGFGTIPADADQDPLSDNYPSQCKTGTDGRYNMVILRPSANTFAATVRWARVTGDGVDELQLLHRMFRSPASPNLSYEPPEEGVGLPSEAEIRVIARKIPPNADNTTPSCNNPATQNKSGTLITLTGGKGTPRTQATDNNSTALFQNLFYFDNYRAEITAPPTDYEACPPTQSNNVRPRPGVVPEINFKIRPICRQQATNHVHSFNHPHPFNHVHTYNHVHESIHHHYHQELRSWDHHHDWLNGYKSNGREHLPESNMYHVIHHYRIPPRGDPWYNHFHRHYYWETVYDGPHTHYDNHTHNDDHTHYEDHTHYFDHTHIDNVCPG